MQLGEITEPKIEQAGPPPTGEFTYIDISSVDNGAKRIVEPKRLPADGAPSRARQRLRSGDVLVSMTRPNLNAVALLPPQLDGAIGSTGFHVLRARDNVLPQWLYYGVQTPQFVGAMSELVQGALYPAVRPKDIRAFDLPVPALDEQRRIVAELETQFSRLDEAVANLKRVKANLKRYKAAVLADAVEGALAGETEGWRTASLGDIASSVRNGISIKPVGESGTRILRISAVRPMALDLDDVRYLAQASEDFDAFRLAAGDVLFTRYNGSIDLVGVCAAVPELPEPTVYPDKLIRVRVPTDTLLPSFLVIAASTGEARAFIRSRIRTTAGQAGVSGADIKGIPVRVPPLSEQRRIVAEVDRRLSFVRELEAELDANLLRADALRRTTLANSFALSD
jgi:type I restriction enzyme S subunit